MGDLNKILTSKIKSIFPSGTQKKGEWWINNPLRDDENIGSFSINLTNGKWHDFATGDGSNMVGLMKRITGETYISLCKKYGADPQFQQDPKFKHNQLGYPYKVYTYKNIDSEEIAYICRLQTPKGKEIRPFSNGRWNKLGFGEPHSLYNLHFLKNASKDQKILIVEGEKTADRAMELLGHMYIVVTWPFGSGNFHKANFEYLKDFKNIYIFPDNDEPGLKAAKGIKKILKQAKIVTIPDNFEKGWDIGDIEDDLSTEELINIIENEPKKKERKESFNLSSDDPRVWLDNWIKMRDVKFLSSHDIKIKDVNYSVNDLIAEMNCDFATYKEEGTTLNPTFLKNAFDLRIKAELDKVRNSVIKSLKYKTDSDDNLRKFITGLLGEFDEVSYAVIAHFIWQVKRKMFGLKVFDHMMPVIYGRVHRQGKSEAIRKLLSPIDSLWFNGKFTDLSDERNAEFFECNYVMFLDEMRGSKKTDIEATKERITAETISYRVLYSHRQWTCKNNCSLIGTTNHPLSTIVKDTTGMRRFYEIEVKQKCNWEMINSIDYVALWRGIDETREVSHIEFFRKEIEAQQEENRSHCSVEEWIIENEVQSGEVENECNELYSSFDHYCRNANIRPDTKRIFYMKLKKFLNIERTKKTYKSFYKLKKLHSPVHCMISSIP